VGDDVKRKRAAMSAAWFIDGAYLGKLWMNLKLPNQKLDYLLLRRYLEQNFLDAATTETFGDSYFFAADPEPPTAKQNAFHNALAFPPPNGPGLRVKIYWLQKKQLYWPNAMGGGPVVHPTSKVQYEMAQQKGVDVGLVFHLMRSFSKQGWKKLFLAAGDGDFHEPIQHLVENENVSLYLIGSLDSMSEELRPYATQIIDLASIAKSIAR
jgi:uncharacterized LabA/DUF88 family protein